MNAQAQPPNGPYQVLSPGLRRAKVHSRSHQRVVFALDGSGSMLLENKAHDAIEATRGCCQELALPVNKDAFEVALILFADTARLIEPFQRPSSLIVRLDELEAKLLGGGTNIAAALALANEILCKATAEPTAADLRYVQPLNVLLSDGCHNEDGDPVVAANKLKMTSDVLTVAFGSDADDEMLAAIATQQLNVRCRNGAELRRYFAQIGRTLTVTRAAGLSVSQAMGIPQA
jgi:Mg-chelatase subunit ChlD